jgi:hypothetical protein
METNKKPSNKFSPEVRARAVRMVQEHRGDHASQWAARRKPVKTTVSDKAAPCPLDTVNRQFQAPRPNAL